MSKASGRGSRDLARTGAASVASLILMVLPVGGLVKALALTPMVLFLPGYAISAAMFPPGTIARSERLVYTVCLSVGAAALGGLLWQLFFDLNRGTWAFLLVTITLVAVGIAQRRRVSRSSSPTERIPLLPRMGLPTVLAMLAATVLTVVAVDTASDGLREQRAEARFTALWIVPGKSAGSVEVGIWNHQAAVHTYRLILERDGTTQEQWRGRLGAHENEQVELGPADLSGTGPLTVSLYKDGALYRRTELQAGGEA